jgi:predicted DNA-binding protein (UPF0251 family)
MDEGTKSQIVQAIENHNDRPKLPYDNENTEIRGMLATSLLHKKHTPMNKREIKRMEKESEIIRLHQIEGMKPSLIARKMKVSANEVYRLVERFKFRASKQ